MHARNGKQAMQPCRLYVPNVLVTCSCFNTQCHANVYDLDTEHFPLMQVFPCNLLPHNYPEPDNPGHLMERSEVERRTDYIKPLYKELGEQHPLVQLVCQCLHNIPARRPPAEKLLQQY